MFVFLSKDLKRVKILVWEITGYWLCSKKLEGGRFVRPVGDNPASRQSAVTLSAAELAMLLEGIQVHRAVYSQHRGVSEG